MPADKPTVYQTTQACQEPNLDDDDPFPDPDLRDPDKGGEEQCKKQQ